MTEPDPAAAPPADVWAPPAGHPVPPARPPRPSGPPVRREAAVGLTVAAALAALGLAVGAVWYALAPHVLYRVAQGGRGIPTDLETKGFVADDGWFFVIGAVTGLLCGFAAYLLARRYGLGVTLGLAVGGLAGALVAWKLGSALGSGAFHDALRTRPVGSTVHAPPGLRAKGVLVAWPVAALVAHTVATAYGREPAPAPAPLTGPPGPAPLP